jgi:ADP-ribosylglycohydrolase
MAVKLGDYADTTGAVYGQLAGEFYGEDGIPEKWRKILAKRSVIESFAEMLMEKGRDGVTRGEGSAGADRPFSKP